MVWARLRGPLSLLAAALLAATVYLFAPDGWLFQAARGGWEFPLYLFLSGMAALLAGDGVRAIRFPAGPPAARPPPAQDWTV